MKNSRKLSYAAASVVLFTVVFGLKVNLSLGQAVNAIWNDGAGNWTTAANWDCPSAGVNCVPNTVPGTAYNAAINSSGVSVTLDNTSGPSYIFVTTLSLQNGTLSVSNGASLGAATMNLTGGTFNVSSSGVAYTRTFGTDVYLGGQPLLVSQPNSSQLVPLVLSGLPSAAEANGDFSMLLAQSQQQIFDPLTNPPSPFPTGIIPVALLGPGMFIPIGGSAVIGGSTGSSAASVTVEGTESSWTVAGALTVNSTGSLAID